MAHTVVRWRSTALEMALEPFPDWAISITDKVWEKYKKIRSVKKQQGKIQHLFPWLRLHKQKLESTDP